MSTASLRERLRRIKLQTAHNNESTASTQLHEKENTSTGTGTACSASGFSTTAPQPVQRSRAPLVFATPSVTNAATSSGLVQERPKARPLSAIETSQARTNPEPTPHNLFSKAAAPKSTPTKARSNSARERNRNDRHLIVNGIPYLAIDLIGKGGSSKVYQVLNESKKRCQAVKCVDLSGADKATKEAYLNEIKLLLDLKQSGCVVQLHDYELRADRLYMVMEKGDVDLASFLKNRKNKIDHIFIRFYWSEMLKCVSAIHNKGVVHSDLKPANFLLIGGNLKLIDFGIASSIPSNKTSVFKDSQMGTLSYMPPEALTGTMPEEGKEVYKVQRKSDVWSLGCILYTMVYGHTPFQQYCSAVQKINAIISKDIVFSPIQDHDLIDVMQKCLIKQPETRASVQQLQQHPYLTKKWDTEESESKDDSYLMKVAQDLQTCTPRTSARKLRRLLSSGHDLSSQLK